MYSLISLLDDFTSRPSPSTSSIFENVFYIGHLARDGYSDPVILKIPLSMGSQLDMSKELVKSVSWMRLSPLVVKRTELREIFPWLIFEALKFYKMSTSWQKINWAYLYMKVCFLANILSSGVPQCYMSK